MKRVTYTAAALGALVCAASFVGMRAETRSAAAGGAAFLQGAPDAAVPTIDPGALPAYASAPTPPVLAAASPSLGRPSAAGEPLWTSVPERGHTFRFPQARYIERGHPVRYDRSRLSRLEVGDALAVVVPGHGRFEFVVEGIRSHANGDHGIQGRLAGAAGDDFRIVLTQGATRTFANLQTPAGIFMLEAEGEQGWVFEDTLDDLIDPSRTDALFPERK